MLNKVFIDQVYLEDSVFNIRQEVKNSFEVVIIKHQERTSIGRSKVKRGMQ